MNRTIRLSTLFIISGATAKIIKYYSNTIITIIFFLFPPLYTSLLEKITKIEVATEEKSGDDNETLVKQDTFDFDNLEEFNINDSDFLKSYNNINNVGDNDDDNSNKNKN